MHTIFNNIIKHFILVKYFAIYTPVSNYICHNVSNDAEQEKKKTTLHFCLNILMFHG